MSTRGGLYVFVLADQLKIGRTVEMMAVPRVGETIWLLDEAARLRVTAVEWGIEGTDGTVSPLLTCELLGGPCRVTEEVVDAQIACAAVHPIVGYSCARGEGHYGEHQNDVYTWPACRDFQANTDG